MSNDNKEATPGDRSSKSSGFLKIIAAIIFVTAIVVFAGLYLAQKEHDYIRAKDDLKQFENIEKRIFDSVQDETRVEQKINLEEFDVNDKMLKQVVMSNNNKIKDVYQKLEIFEQGFARFESSIKLQQAIISYVKFRDKLRQGGDYQMYLDNFKLLITENLELTKKVRKLEELLLNFKNLPEIENDFKLMIADLTAIKKHDPDAGFVQKVRFSFAKLISVRKLDQFDSSIDGFIYRVSNYLQHRNCSAIIDEVSNVEKKYQQKLSSFQGSVTKFCDVEKIDSEIFESLEELSS